MFSSFSLAAQQEFSLYENDIPEAKPCNVKREFTDTSWNKNGLLIDEHVIKPTISVFEAPADKRNGTAVLICPGGGYSALAVGHEGADVAKAFNAAGVTAFVLRYRLPDDACMTNKAYVPLMDAQQALYFIRSHAKTYNIDTSKVGIMGFSAGGHLAASVGTHFNNPVRQTLSGADLHPDFMMLIYPVISFTDSLAHRGSRENLIGKNASDSLVSYFSNEEQVTDQTPPTFLVHASDDDAVNPANSVAFYEALLRHHIPAELHIYERGGHGFGLNNTTTKDYWFERCLNWMRSNGWL